MYNPIMIIVHVHEKEKVVIPMKLPPPAALEITERQIPVQPTTRNNHKCFEFYAIITTNKNKWQDILWAD